MSVIMILNTIKHFYRKCDYSTIFIAFLDVDKVQIFKSGDILLDILKVDLFLVVFYIFINNTRNEL